MNILYLEIGLKSSIFLLFYQLHSSVADCARELFKRLFAMKKILGVSGFFVIDITSEVDY